MNDVSRLFGEEARAYASFRPAYPPALFDWLAAHCSGQQRALDIGCGNGQASQALLSHFAQVLACDISPAQLEQVPRQNSLQLFAADARKLPLQDNCLDLLIVAQALHWFADTAFFAEAGRVLKPGGLFCAWCYGLMQINPAVDALVKELHGDLLKDYWPAGRATVDAGYSSIHTDFAQIRVPRFVIELHWSFEHMLGYLRTWSAVQLWQRENGKDPLDIFIPRLIQAWGDTRRQHLVSWPLHFVAGRPGT